MTTERRDCWPTQLQVRLLRAALLDGDAAIRAWHEWQSSALLDNLDPGSVRLLPLLYQNLVRLGVPSPLLARLKGTHRQAWCRNQILFDSTAHAAATLQRAGIETLLLKGVPLAILCYRSGALRPMADADILVHPADVPAAVQVLRSIGWAPAIDPGRWPVEPLASWSLVKEGAPGQELDLHWRVFAESFQSDAGLWERSRPLHLRGTATRALAAPEQLVHVLVHGIYWNPIPSIRWVADAMAVIGAAGDQFDWDEVLGLAERRRFQPLLKRGLRYLESAVALKIPGDVNRRLDSRRTTRGEGLAIAARVRPGPAWAAYRLWHEYRRFAADHGLRVSPVGYWHYLGQLWLPGSSSRLPWIIARKVASRRRHLRSG